ncbi:MAG: hypothetical protein ACREPE_07505 [Lysobacter sp.]
MGVLFEEPAIAIDLRNNYRRLTGPALSHWALSYWAYRNADGELRWLDRAQQPPVVIEHEPDTNLWQCGVVRVMGWLPIESQL